MQYADSWDRWTLPMTPSQRARDLEHSSALQGHQCQEPWHLSSSSTITVYESESSDKKPEACANYKTSVDHFVQNPEISGVGLTEISPFVIGSRKMNWEELFWPGLCLEAVTVMGSPRSDSVSATQPLRSQWCRLWQLWCLCRGPWGPLICCHDYKRFPLDSSGKTLESPNPWATPRVDEADKQKTDQDSGFAHQPVSPLVLVSGGLTLYTVPNAPEPSTLIFLNSVSFKILKRAWLGASPLGVRGSTSCERQGRRSTWRRLTQRTLPAYLKEETHTFSKNLMEGMLTKGLPGTGVLEQNSSISTNESSLSSQLAGLREFWWGRFLQGLSFWWRVGPPKTQMPPCSELLGVSPPRDSGFWHPAGHRKPAEDPLKWATNTARKATALYRRWDFPK